MVQRLLIAVAALVLAISCGPPKASDNHPPTLWLRSPLIAPLLTPVTFDATETKDSGGIAYLQIEPGDGSSAFEISGLLFTHTFRAPATYQVVVTAVDTEARTSSLTRSITVVERYTPPYCDEALPCEHAATCDLGECFVEGDGSM